MYLDNSADELSQIAGVGADLLHVPILPCHLGGGGHHLRHPVFTMSNMENGPP